MVTMWQWCRSRSITAVLGIVHRWRSRRRQVHQVDGRWLLAWFENPLHRELGVQAAAAFESMWHLTLLSNTADHLAHHVHR
jgi:hypothetical protein